MSLPLAAPGSHLHPRGENMDRSGIIDWLMLALLPGLGAAAKRRLLNAGGDPGELAQERPLEQMGFRGERSLEVARRARPGLRRLARSELAAARRLGVRILPRSSREYPAELEQLPDPPVVLYKWGTFEGGVTRAALIGSRRCTAYGRRIAAGLSASLTRQGLEVVSGGARGIDTAAHKGALEAGGSTIAVLGAGLGRLYPPENRDLFREIAGSGAVLSELPMDAPARPEQFPRRNRLIAALSAAVVVVEAAGRSGALITARQALDLGREVMAVPGPIHSPVAEGCHRLIQQGARLVHTSADILDELSPMYTSGLRSPSPGAGPGAETSEKETIDERAVVAVLDVVEPRHIDELAERTPLGTARLQAALFSLVLRGSVEELTGRYYVLRPKTEV
ncbi:hypothetical protein ABI59_13280 [Acidobacteria bacterium Mor1]|nr:hypothetical protein ABI59_13280 [Acidobacteria bacterium Mor1]